MDSITAIDPGNHMQAWALFLNKKMIDCVYTEDVRAIRYGRRIVVELPQVYSQGKGDPNDLIQVAFAAGRCVGKGKFFETVLPGQWKGQVPKKIHNRRVLAKLTPEEHVVLDAAEVRPSLRHNIIDAIGIGLWRVKR